MTNSVPIDNHNRTENRICRGVCVPWSDNIVKWPNVQRSKQKDRDRVENVLGIERNHEKQGTENDDKEEDIWYLYPTLYY